MTIPLDYMNSLTKWQDPPKWNAAWADKVAEACNIICERDREIDLLKAQVKHLHDATIVLRFTMQHGAGCETCIEQNKARDEADRLINKAMDVQHGLNLKRAAEARQCNPMHPGDPSMCFGDETTCKCLHEE